VIHQETLTRLLVERGIFAKEEFLEMVRVVDREMNRWPKTTRGRCNDSGDGG
jgi:hypothetical protein